MWCFDPSDLLPEPEIHRAARRGDRAELERLVDAGADVDERAPVFGDHGPFWQGLTPLLIAAASQDGADVETLRWLLDHGASLQARSEGKTSAAWYAAGQSYSRESGRRTRTDEAERLRFLLDAGLDPWESAPNGRSLLVEACTAGSVARVQLLLARGVDPAHVVEPWAGASGPDGQGGSRFLRSLESDLEDEAVPDEVRDASDGEELGEGPRHPVVYTIPLFCAAVSGSVDCVQTLLEAGVDPNTLDGDGSSALFFARSVDVMRALLAAGTDPKTHDKRGDDALQSLLQKGDGDERELIEAARVLVGTGVDLERADDHGVTRLMGLGFIGEYRSAAFLLDCGADPLVVTPDGGTVLMAVCWPGEPSEPEALIGQDRLIARLVEAGVRVDAADSVGCTAMHQAVEGDAANLPALRALLRHGARVDPVMQGGTTPLMLAAAGGEVECVRVLLEHGADPTRKDEDDLTAVDHAHENVEAWSETDSPLAGKFFSWLEKVFSWLEGQVAEFREDDAPPLREQALEDAKETVRLLEAAAGKR